MKKLQFLLFISITFSGFANDSLKVKTIKYYEKKRLLRVEGYDTLNRMVRLVRTPYISVSNKLISQELQLFDYFGNSHVVRNAITLYLPRDTNMVFFNENPIGTARVTEYDSSRREGAEKLAKVNIDEVMLKRWIPKDSIPYLKMTMIKQKGRTYISKIYDTQGRVINEKNKDMGVINYTRENSYDSKSRLIVSFIEKTFDAPISDDPNNRLSYEFYKVTEKSILKTIYNDAAKTSETTLEDFRRGKLYKKQTLKNRYDLDNNLIVQEGYLHNIVKGEEKNEPTLIYKITNIYEQGLRTKHITYDVATNQTIMNELVYEFW